MVDKTLHKSKEAIFAVCTPHPNPQKRESTRKFPYPIGTGFFISEDGYFLTARHVLIKETSTGEKVLQDLKEVLFQKPEGHLVKNAELVRDWPRFDIALLKADFEECKKESVLKIKRVLTTSKSRKRLYLKAPKYIHLVIHSRDHK